MQANPPIVTVEISLSIKSTLFSIEALKLSLPHPAVDLKRVNIIQKRNKWSGIDRDIVGTIF